MLRRRLVWLLCLTAAGCAGDDEGRPPASTEPAATGGSTDTGGPDDGDDDGDTTGSPGTTSTTASLPDSGSSDAPATDSDGGSSTGSTGPATGEPGDWLLTIDDAANPPVVVRIDTVTGAGTVICPLPAASSYNSLALARDGTLYAHNATQSRIERVDPCDCGFQIVGPTSAGTLEIGVDEDDDLLGIDNELDALYRLDAQTGLANAIGPLGLDFIGSALTWSDALPGAYAIDDGTTQLYNVSVETGNATLVATLSQLVTAPGLAYRASTDTAYVCDGNTLYELGTGSGVLTEIGPIGLEGACTSLAAPFVAEACLE